MRTAHFTALAAVLAFGLSDTRAAPISRNDLIQAPAACVSGMPTDPIRNRVGGVRNAGTEPLYLLCGFAADYHGDYSFGAGTSYIAVRVSNTGPTTATVQCVLHTGWATSSTTTNQGSFVQSQGVLAGNDYWFEFSAGAYLEPGETWANPTVICKLNQKVEVMYLYRDYHEEIGA